MMRKQSGQIIRIGDRWYARYWERRNIGGKIERKRVTRFLGAATGRGKRPPADIVSEAERHMATVNGGSIPPEQIVSIGDFVATVFLPWITVHKRASTAKGYRLIWKNHLAPLCQSAQLKDMKTHHVQNWLNEIGKQGLGKNSLKHIKSVISAIFTLAKQQGFFQQENPAWEAAINPGASAPAEQYAYDLEEIQQILSLLPEPAATIFATAAYAGLRHGELMGMEWPDWRDGELHVERDIWNGKVDPCKTKASQATVPVIKQLAYRLELHRARGANATTGPIFRNSVGKPLSLGSVVDRHILPALNRCAVCGKRERDHLRADHAYRRDETIPHWHGWHAARRGLGSNLYRLGVPDKVIQRILRHANLSTTTGYYIKSQTKDVLDAMAKLENSIPDPKISESDTQRTLSADSVETSASIQ
jgi:integrase